MTEKHAGRTPTGGALTILGSGTLLPDDAHHSAAHLLESHETRLLLDCGPGTLHGLARHRVRWRRITHVALTHFHLDHVGDVAALLFALKWGTVPPRTEPLTLLGPRGVGAWLADLGASFGDFVLDPGFELRVVELDPARAFEDRNGGLAIRCHATPHTEASLAFRVDVVEGTLGYTGDTGPSEAVAAFLRGCDVLITECSLADPTESQLHLSPRSAAEMARVARPGLLVLTHAYPPLTTTSARDAVREAGYSGPVLAGEDGLRVVLGEGGASRAAGTEP